MGTQSKEQQYLALLRKHGICTECGELYEHEYDSPFASCNCGTSEWHEYTPHMIAMRKKAYSNSTEGQNVIFDLDGTLALCDHRRHHVEGPKKNWQAFFDECDKDEVNVPVQGIFNFYMGEPNVKVFILSGRSGDDVTLSKTVNWLAKNGLTPDHFEMRKPGDRRHDVTIKSEMVKKLGLTPENTIAVFDDRNSVVKMWRDMGFTCFQVADGDF